MADNFLQSSRAEMADVSKFQDLDFVNLVQQALDDVYAVAHSKKIKARHYIARYAIMAKR